MNILPKYSINNQKKFIVLLWISLAILIIVSILSILIGSVKIEFSELITILINPNQKSPHANIILNVRIPRMIGALLAGSALSVSGSLLQSVMNNSLASPSIIGVNSGAAFFAVLIFACFPYQYELIPIAAFLGAFLTTMLVYLIALKTGASRISIILAGVALSNIISAGIDFFTLILPDQLLGTTSFMIGGLAGLTLNKLYAPMLYIFTGLALSLLFAPSLNILNLGDELAGAVGMNVKKYRFIFIAIAALLAGSAVSFTGLLGFVGLLVPHITRMIIGTDSRHLIPLSALFGAIFVIICDTLVRVIFAPYEIPVGIMMSFLGGPFFIWLLINQRRGRLNV